MKITVTGEPQRSERGVFSALKQIYTRADAAVERGLKGLFWPPNPRPDFLISGGKRVDFSGDMGDATSSSTVTAPLFWVVRTFPEAPPMLWKKLPTMEEEPVPKHRMLDLLERPNGFYTGINLWMATVIDYQVDGNAYWWKKRDRIGLPKELWWMPHWLIEPKGTSEFFITHYEYRSRGETIEIPKDDIVHFRFGLDGDNPKLGRSPLKSVLREVFTDDEAAMFTASLLRNMGVPGLIVSPKQGSISPEEASQAKQFLMNQFGGERRGDPLVQTGPTEIEQFGFSPEQLLLRELRRIPEERVTAVMGIPAIVAGLGAGLDRSTFTNMGEAREAAYEAGIIPMQRNLGEDVRFQLLNEYESDVHGWRFGFNLAKVRVLQEDLTRQAQRHGQMVRDGIEMVSEARRGMGLEVDESHAVFLRPMNTIAVDADGAVLAESNGNGSINGVVDASEIARELARAAQT